MDPLVRLYQGHVLDQLRGLASRSVHTVVTSPPYWGLRDYGTGNWVGGSTDCDHKPDSRVSKAAERGGQNSNWDHVNEPVAGVCAKCGAIRQNDHQLGSERTPAEYLRNMVEVFREVRRVLRRDGTLWLNMGDSYGTGSSGGGVFEGGKLYDNHTVARGGQVSGDGGKAKWAEGHVEDWDLATGLPPGNIVGMPWRLAFALQADGWVLRQDLIWYKPGPMPESVDNRCTKAHEYLFLLTLEPSKYFFDQEAIKEKAKYGYRDIGFRDAKYLNNNAHDNSASKHHGMTGDSTVNNPAAGAIKRSVWEVASYSYPGAHFATFPPKLIEPCILAGTSAMGVCDACGAPWERMTERVRIATRPAETSKVYKVADQASAKRTNQNVGSLKPNVKRPAGWASKPGVPHNNMGYPDPAERQAEKEYRESQRLPEATTGNRDPERHITEVRTTGWRPGCHCYPWKPIRCDIIRSAVDHVIPATVLDPFMGSGTTAVVATDHGRRAIGIELSTEYLRQNAIPRIEGALLCHPQYRHLVDRPKTTTKLGGHIQ